MNRSYLAYLLLCIGSCCIIASLEAKINSSLPEPLPPPKPITLEGLYQIQGTNNKGKPYSGVGRLAKRGEGWFVTWFLFGGTYEGLGIQQGNSLALAQSSDSFEVGSYTLTYRKGIPILTGKWITWPGSKETGTEIWTWQTADLESYPKPAVKEEIAPPPAEEPE